MTCHTTFVSSGNLNEHFQVVRCVHNAVIALTTPVVGKHAFVFVTGLHTRVVASIIAQKQQSAQVVIGFSAAFEGIGFV